MNMEIASYERMKKYMDSFKKNSVFNSFLTFKIRYYANSIDIMECFRYDRKQCEYEIELSRSQINNFTEYTYNKLINEMLMKIKTNEINKKLDEIKKDF